MAKNQHSISATDMLLSLAKKFPENLMLDTEDAEGLFTLCFLLRLSPEQLANLKEAMEFHKDENVFLFFYVQRQGQSEHAVELKDFEGFDFSKVIKINFNGNTAPLLYYSDLPPVHYVSVTFTLA